MDYHFRFELTDSQLNLYYPNGEPFTTYLEIARQWEESKQQLQQKRQRADKLAEKLRDLGLNPEDI